MRETFDPSESADSTAPEEGIDRFLGFLDGSSAGTGLASFPADADRLRDV
jgi:hypothetical protein